MKKQAILGNDCLSVDNNKYCNTYSESSRTGTNINVTKEKFSKGHISQHF